MLFEPLQHVLGGLGIGPPHCEAHVLPTVCSSEAAQSRRPRPWEESPAGNGNASPFCKYEAGLGPHGRRGPCGKDAEDYLKLLSRIRKLPVCASLQ